MTRSQFDDWIRSVDANAVSAWAKSLQGEDATYRSFLAFVSTRLEYPAGSPDAESDDEAEWMTRLKNWWETGRPDLDAPATEADAW